MGKSELELRVDQVIQSTKNNLARREKQLKKILREAELAQDVFVVGRVNLLLSICYFDLGNRNSILPHAVKAVDVFKKLTNRNLLAGSYTLLGLAYRAQGNYSFAVKSYNRALEAIHCMKKPAIRRDVMNSNIAECYYLMGEYKRSIQILLKCLNVIRTKHPEDYTSAVIYSINLSDNYESLGKYESALAVLDDAKLDAERMDRDVLLWAYFFRRSCVLYMCGDLENGAKYADLGIDAIKNGYDSYEFHRDIEKIATLEIAAGDLDRAQSMADILTNYAAQSKHTLDLISSRRIQSKICLARGEQQQGLLLLRDLNNLYARRMREQCEMQYESQKSVEDASREIKKLMERFRLSEKKAEYDALTGLLNRAAMVTITNEFIQKAKEKGMMLGGIFLDIDFFKEYNDTYGHAAGDDAIRYVADVCQNEVNDNVRFFRYGGDEFFGVVLGQNDHELERAAQRISEKVSASGYEHCKNPNGQRLTVSVGVVNLAMKGYFYSLLDVIKLADKALYRAKELGKNTVFTFRNMPDSGEDYLME